MGVRWPGFADKDDVAAQFAQLDADGYGAEARLTLAATHALLDACGLVDLGRLGALNSRNHARRVRTRHHGQAVLKLTAVIRGDETGALLTWQRHDSARTRTAAVYAHGRTDHGYEWSIQQLLAGATPKAIDAGVHLDAAIDLA
jgi:hypothetical protein